MSMAVSVSSLLPQLDSRLTARPDLFPLPLPSLEPRTGSKQELSLLSSSSTSQVGFLPYHCGGRSRARVADPFPPLFSVGFTQEWKAEKTVAALASVGSPTATVIRHDSARKRGSDGQTATIQAEDVVPFVPVPAPLASLCLD